MPENYKIFWKYVRITQTDGEKRVIGLYSEDRGIFRAERKKSKHFYRKLNAWGIDAKALDGMEEINLEEVQIIDVENKEKYTADIETIRKFGEYLHHKPHRAQVFLPLKYWKKE